VLVKVAIIAIINETCILRVGSFVEWIIVWRTRTPLI